jgi:hypothetical protein
MRYRVSPIIATFWLGCIAIFCLFTYFVVYRLLHMPAWMLVFFFGLALAGVISAIPMLSGYVQLTDESISQRVVRAWRVRWSDVNAWTRSSSTICFRTSTGRVRSLHHWLAAGRRLEAIAQQFERRVGPEATGADAVLPEFVGSLLSAFAGRKVK